MTDTTQKPLNAIAHELLTGHECRLHIADAAYRGADLVWWEVIPDGIWERVPQYDTDIAAAWRLLEAMRKSPFASIALHSDSDGHVCSVIVSDVDYAIAEGDRTLGIVKRSVSGTKTLRICPESAQSMPLAITTAFIEACKPEGSQ